MLIQNARVFCPDGSFAVRDLYLDDATGRISAAPCGGEVLDAAGLTAIPGLVDLHFHGCVGHDFCEGTEEAIQAIADYQASVGVMAICPATMTYPEAVLARVADAAAAHQNGRGADLVGINMEGPFISPQKVGAQNPAYVQPPDAAMFRRLQARAGGLFKLCDIAPEQPGALDCIRQLAGQVRCSLAHTCADYDTAARAFAAGASHMTHLYNAMPGISHRAPGPILAAAEAGAEVELICDNVHVHPAVVRMTFKLFGDDKVILISDSMMAAGLPEGVYELGGQSVTVQGRRAVLTHQPETIAGSCTNLFECMRRAVREMDVPLGSAVKAAALNPARSLGLQADYGSLEPGRWANVLLLDEALQPVYRLQKGRLLPV